MFLGCRLAALFCFLLVVWHGSIPRLNAAELESFSPQGTIKGVRQITARFSEQMVAFGDLRLDAPFDISCSSDGSGRWIDGRNWVYDFDKDLPAGELCEFTIKKELKTVAGQPITGEQKFTFNTGGPAVKEIYPNQNSRIDEEQVFIIQLDGSVNPLSISAHARCETPDIPEQIGLTILPEATRRQLLTTLPKYVVWNFSKYFRELGSDDESRFRSMMFNDPTIIAVQCQRSLPNDQDVKLIWGKGMQALNGIATQEDQTFSFKTRRQFGVSFSCDRMNAEAACVPFLPMRLSFSAPVSRHKAGSILIKTAGGKTYKPDWLEKGHSEFVHYIDFKGPFPEKTDFFIELPEDLKDDSGRPLDNADEFPLKVATDIYPPIAKFPARFGIIELNADPALPVTLRNLEAMLSARNMREWGNERGDSIFSGAAATTDFTIPKPLAPQEFEVVGIPLKKPGFYVVELKSPKLGEALLENKQPMLVQTTTLVTNLAAHFKWGEESSLVWVTTLDQATPVPDAAVAVRDCNGKLLWQGTTDMAGVALIRDKLEDNNDYKSCRHLAYGKFVSARTKDDMTFVLSSWDDGIEPWQFKLPYSYDLKKNSAHTVLDRSLLRAGETVHMKHFFRKHSTKGYAFANDLPSRLIIEHVGSGQKFEMGLTWNNQGIAETDWQIPIDARQGNYHLEMHFSEESKNKYDTYLSGGFRVETFKVPTMRALIQPPKEPLVNVGATHLDLQVEYLSGGGAGNSPVILRSLVRPKSVVYKYYDDYEFDRGDIKPGIKRWSYMDEFDNPEPEDTDSEGNPTLAPAKNLKAVKTLPLTLDKAGALRAVLTDLPKVTKPHEIIVELEFKDANGENLTVSKTIPLWPAKISLGIRTDSWAGTKDKLKFRVVALDLSGKPAVNVPVTVDMFQDKSYSHRKRMIGGFYTYETISETERLGDVCQGNTNEQGLLLCESKPTVSGQVILRARAKDDQDNLAVTNQTVWIAGEEDWWFKPVDSDRMDLLPEKKHYEPGETARFQVRMPFRSATALVTVEREGIVDIFLRKLSGKDPVIEIPIQGNYAPNVFVSVLAVRGRIGDVVPTALIDLGKPAFKLGMAEIHVGWRAHELLVDVKTKQEVFKVRDKVAVKIAVKHADGSKLPKGGEVAIAAVDEGLLELMPNNSWKLLEAMMGRRGIDVLTSTAQMQVVGKRHYGKKSVPPGGSGGRLPSRELFDTLLFWKARVSLDDNGEAFVEIPLNDLLTSFRIVAVASNGPGLFGTGKTTIRTSQDIMLHAGLPALVREGDRIRSVFTVRNVSDQVMPLALIAKVTQLQKGISTPINRPLTPINATLAPGEAKEIAWPVEVPAQMDTLQWEVIAQDQTGAQLDRLQVKQQIKPVFPVRVFQATLAQLDKPWELDVAKPEDAIAARGGIQISLQPKLGDDLPGVKEYMTSYPFTCLEQQISRAVALRDSNLWTRVVNRLPAFLDGDGLARYFPSDRMTGSDVLTAYILAIAHEAGLTIPDNPQSLMLAGLKKFVLGKITRDSGLMRVADLTIRKLAAIEALSRYSTASPEMLTAITIDPNLWPTSAIIDWLGILKRIAGINDQEKRLSEVMQILRSRLYFQGTTMGFAAEKNDFLWWLMISPDSNAVRSILALLDEPGWREDMGRMVRGAMSRHYKGHWDTTPANAWGVLAMGKFSLGFETTPVTGETTASLKEKSNRLDWTKTPEPAGMLFGWPGGREKLKLEHLGSGKPWATIQSLAAIPLTQPVSSGYKIKRLVEPVVQKTKGVISRGDVLRITLEFEAQSDMTWVVVSDPIPAGSTILGSGLGRDSSILTQDEKKNRLWPAFIDRTFEVYRAYFEYVPKGSWQVSYTLRINAAGDFELPTTRIEAMYSPEMFGEIPNVNIKVLP